MRFRLKRKKIEPIKEPKTPICKHQNKEVIAVLRFSVNFIKKPIGKPDNPLWRDHEIPLFQCMDCFKFLYPEKPLNWFNISPVDPDYLKTK